MSTARSRVIHIHTFTFMYGFTSVTRDAVKLTHCNLADALFTLYHA